ncbi:aminodeoxychorismate/anthranilate synthase component II [Citricoccus zhacaiensis]|uniref:Aminodeoxychorismate/anthranilate synthase component II n=2 Tax=Citricoccus zhacaiensis TaxID=489142 RepID=A0ABQ2LTW1_9MICC|nr:aminodeoxychorismate/anthranilate synthase component II [Citricoccus zhacaiensis]
MKYSAQSSGERGPAHEAAPGARRPPDAPSTSGPASAALPARHTMGPPLMTSPTASTDSDHATVSEAVSPARILVVDNYDSFVYTLVGYLRELGADTLVVRNDAVSLDEATELAAERDGILLSPGPGTPAEAGISTDMVRWAAEQGKPLYGVCLGHQAISEAHGATVTHAEELMHGKTSRVVHGGHPMFAGVPDPFTATRYHSLAAVRATIPEELEITAETDGGIVMGVAHRSVPLWGVQFHPESVLTEGGYRMLGNWLESLGMVGAAARADTLSPVMG